MALLGYIQHQTTRINLRLVGLLLFQMLDM